MKNIQSVKINFRAATSVKPNLTSTRAGDRIKFYDIKTGVVEDTGTGGGSDGDDDEYIDPNA